MSTDGVNPFGNQSSTHSTWLVVLSVLNLPPWLCKKRKYLMLSILVSGPKQPGDRIDVYLRPLVDDLQTLWRPGVEEVWDEFEHKYFTLHAMLFTTINDNPAHRNLSGQSKRNDEACPRCLDETCSLWLRKSKKFVFLGHRCFLHKKHPYWNVDCQFDGEKEERMAPPHVSRVELHLQVKDIKTIEELPKKTILGKRKKRDGEEEDGQGMWNKKSILWELEYWELLDVRHSIDTMHTKTNVCESLCGTLLQ